MHFLALDIGSSFIKGAVLDAEKLTIEHVTRVPFPEPIAGLPAGYFEIDPRLVMEAVREVLEALLSKAAGARGVLFSSQMGGVILANRGGHSLSNYISWRDQRTTEQHHSESSYLEHARSLLGGCMETLGNEFRAGSSLAIVYWLREQKMLPDTAIPMPLGDYVLQQICQSGPTPADPTLALGLVDLRVIDCHFFAFHALKLSYRRRDWPELGAV